MIREARGGGSVSPYVLKELKELAAQSNKLNLCECTCVEHAHWNEAQRTWGVLLTNGQNIEVDYIFVATGRYEKLRQPLFNQSLIYPPGSSISRQNQYSKT
jgi:2-polyprenyl-6-methoxyphenol hydroxylase-like FAD-dependent oxidoreductase